MFADFGEIYFSSNVSIYVSLTHASTVKRSWRLYVEYVGETDGKYFLKNRTRNADVFTEFTKLYHRFTFNKHLVFMCTIIKGGFMKCGGP